ncbi:hypothetical protein F9L07_00590 [Pimelobacter simplex]|uniref:Uncharacterized protein n=1 Tax=Nocardioides simplex TaxID=2045 RepID=A0A7J5DXA0_NOCSI|nr:hypothetical protein [Pimelobacter simplex]KAB2810508.1 hypothetical protein F9L07_00590 [Pimelobacter simplex]
MRRKDERGAVALLVTALMSVLLVSSAFAVDLGVQRVARSDVQALADVVALDLARSIDGRTVDQLRPALDAQLPLSLRRNTAVFGRDVPTLTYRLGVLGSDGSFEERTTGVPDAVQVAARTDVDFAFASVMGTDHGSAQRRAVAASSSTACFRLGTFVAAIRSGDSTVLGPLNDLLGVNLDLVSYRALADADVRLSQLSAVSSIGSPEHLLTGNIAYADLLRAMAEALTREGGGTNTVAVQALNKLAASSTAATVGMISLANVLHVAPTDRAALEVALSVLDIVGSARLSNGQYFLGVPNIQGQVPGVGFQFSGGISLVSAAELACGAPNTTQATARTAQLDGTVDIAFTNLPSLNVAGVGTLQTAKGTGSIAIVAGDGTGQLVAPPSIRCGAGTLADPSSFGVDVSTGLASYSMTVDLTAGGDVKLTDLIGLNLTSVLTNLLGNILTLGSKISVEVGVKLTISTSRTPSHNTVTVAIPPNDKTPVTTGGSVFLDVGAVVPTITGVKLNGKVVPVLSQVTALTNPILNELVVASGGFVKKSLTPLVDNVNQQFIGPVARMIGLRLAGADVYGVGVTCGMPRLVG